MDTLCNTNVSKFSTGPELKLFERAGRYARRMIFEHAENRYDYS